MNKLNKIFLSLILILNIVFLVPFKLGLTGYFLANIIGQFAQSIYLFFRCKIYLYIKIIIMFLML